MLSREGSQRGSDVVFMIPCLFCMENHQGSNYTGAHEVPRGGAPRTASAQASVQTAWPLFAAQSVPPASISASSAHNSAGAGACSAAKPHLLTRAGATK